MEQNLTLLTKWHHVLLRWATEKSGIPFCLWNGLSARLYRLDNPHISEVARSCCKPLKGRVVVIHGLTHPQCHYVAKITIEGEDVYLIYSQTATLLDVLSQLQNPGTPFVEPYTRLDAVTHNSQSWLGTNRNSELIKRAIDQKVAPHILVLIENEWAGHASK